MISPMMQHYLQIKENYKDSVVFYRLGDFYEFFFDDAVEMSKVLDLTLTGKDCGLEERAPMCGIPHHAADAYIAKLISLGYKVAICEQLSEPKKGVKIVERDVIRVITPGTVVDTSMLDEKSNNYISCVYESDNSIGLSYCDLSTGEFVCTMFEGNDRLKDLNDALVRILPSEVITNSKNRLDENLSVVKLMLIPKFSYYNENRFDLTFADNILKQQFGDNYKLNFKLNSQNDMVISGGALVSYMNETQKRALSHINTIVKLNNNKFMTIDINTRRNLEIIETMKDRRKKGSLIGLLDKTKTSMGARLFKSWLEQPLNDSTEINDRLKGVDELYSDLVLRDKISKELKILNDIERISGKISYGNLTPRDCVALKNSLAVLPNIKHLLSKCKSKKINNISNGISDFSDVVLLLENAIDDNPPALLSGGGFIKHGYNKDLDVYKRAMTDGKKWIIALEQKERETTGIKNLKIGFNKVFGFYLEVNKSNLGLVPLHYQRKQTVANNERFITEELKEIEDKILGAEEQGIKLEQRLFAEIREKLMLYVMAIQSTAKNIAELDCLLSFAEIAIKNNYVKPIINNNIEHIKIIEGRHPVVEDLLKTERFISNDTYLNSTTDRTMIITGPNMAGKSTYMRQVAVITLLAHIGCFVPAKQAEIAVTDRIFTRVGASDDLAFGQSTFMVEMMEVASILDNATSKSLIVLDEIGRGTSTFDGLAIAWSVVEYLANNMKAKTLFATHYHELTELENILEGVKNYKISIKEINGNIVFLRKIIRGGANRSFGIEVARLAGVPQAVIDRAKEISKNLEDADINKNIMDDVPQEKQIKNTKDLEAVSFLKDLDINRLSPMEAFDIMHELILKLKG